MARAGEARTEQGIEHAASSEAWLRHTLEEILSQIRVLLDVDGCAFQTIDFERSHITPAASWFETRRPARPRCSRCSTARTTPSAAASPRRRSSAARPCSSPTWSAGRARARCARGCARSSTRRPRRRRGSGTGRRRSSPARSAPPAGASLGVLALSASPPRPPLSREHLRVTEVFASLAALALERSELLEREASRARAEELLHGAAQTMTASLDLDAVYRVDRRAGGARHRRADRRARAPGRRDADAAHGRQRRRARAARDASASPSARAWSGPSPSAGRRTSAAPSDRARFAVGRRSRACARSSTCRSASGRGASACCRSATPARTRSASASSRCSSRSRRPAAGAIANALEFQHERRIARALTRGYIPDAPPELDGFALGLVYEPAGHEVSGGDIFGVWRLPGGALAVLVGDVSGKGLEVAAVSAMVRFFIEARTWDSDCPATVLDPDQRDPAQPPRRADRARDGVPRDRRRRRPAIRERRPRPAARRRRRRPAARAADDRPAARHRGRRPLRARASGHAGRSDLLFASTDGLFEGRRDGEQFGQERVSALVAEHAARLSPQELVELAYARALAWTPQLGDDVAIIALRPR